MDFSLPGSSVHGIFQARMLEWIALPSSRGSSWPGIEPNSMSPAPVGEFFTTSTTWEVLGLCTEMQLTFVSDSSVQFSSVQFSHSVVSDSLRPHGLQHARLPCPLPTPGVYSNSCPLSRYAIQPSHPLSSPSPPAFSLSQHQGLFKWVSSLHQVAKVLEFQLKHQSFQWIFRTDFL